eukprot:11195718-Lingulodinium_polyedra.AAC.1
MAGGSASDPPVPWGARTVGTIADWLQAFCLKAMTGLGGGVLWAQFKVEERVKLCSFGMGGDA